MAFIFISNGDGKRPRKAHNNMKKDKSYSEACGRPNFNWRDYLNNENSVHTDMCAYIKSVSWKTCACGIMSNRIKRNKFGAPIDAELYKLGYEFTNVFKDYFIRVTKKPDRKKALYILNQIEERATILLEIEDRKGFFKRLFKRFSF